MWQLSHRADQKARLVADRHYNRQKIGTPQFVPPGRCLVLYAGDGEREALWVTSYPFAKYAKHAWAGAWVCSCFRNEGYHPASDAIRQALAHTRWKYGDPPELGLVSFIDGAKVQHVKQRGKDTIGFSWVKAGAKFAGMTKGGLFAFQFTPDVIPQPCPPLHAPQSPPAA